MRNHINSRAILSDLRVGGDRFPRVITLNVQPGWSAWNPTTTDGPITGPAEVTYIQQVDGGIDVMVKPEPMSRPLTCS